VSSSRREGAWLLLVGLCAPEVNATGVIMVAALLQGPTARLNRPAPVVRVRRKLRKTQSARHLRRKKKSSRKQRIGQLGEVGQGSDRSDTSSVESGDSGSDIVRFPLGWNRVETAHTQCARLLCHGPWLKLRVQRTPRDHRTVRVSIVPFTLPKSAHVVCLSFNHQNQRRYAACAVNGVYPGTGADFVHRPSP